jgi:hypothetical protein
MTCINKLKHVMICKSLRPRCFGRWLPTNYVWWFANHWHGCRASMYISKAEGVLNYGQICYSFIWAFWSGWNIWFSTLHFKNIIIAFLPLNVTTVVQPLDQEIIASFKVQYKKKLLEWVLSHFGSFTNLQALRNIVPNVRHAIVWCSQVWRELNPQIKHNNWRMSKILLGD